MKKEKVFHKITVHWVNPYDKAQKKFWFYQFKYGNPNKERGIGFNFFLVGIAFWLKEPDF